jgi:hypothetical protein
MKYATLSKVFKLSALGASLAFALAGPAMALRPGGPLPGPTFSTSTDCVLNRLGAGDCIISGNIGFAALQSFYNGPRGDIYDPAVGPIVVSGTAANSAGGPTTYMPDATLTAASITGSPFVSVIGFGCNNTATVPGATDPCYINVAVRAGGVVGGVLQGELSYSYAPLDQNTFFGPNNTTYVQTGTVNPLVETEFEAAGVTPAPAPPGEFLVNEGFLAPYSLSDGFIIGGWYEWDYFSSTPVPVGYDVTHAIVDAAITIDPPVSDYLNADVGGTYDSPLVILGEDGQRIGDAGVLGSNTPESFGLSSPGSGVPEPTTLGLLGLGALAAAFGRKRRGVVGL